MVRLREAGLLSLGRGRASLWLGKCDLRYYLGLPGSWGLGTVSHRVAGCICDIAVWQRKPFQAS